MATPKLICFDWDGTLIDSFEKIATAIFETAKKIGLKKATKPSIKSKIGLPFEQLLKELYGVVDVEDFIDQYHRMYDQLPTPKLFPNCVHMLSTLKENGYLLAIVTNKSRRSAEAEIDAHNLREMFDAIYCSEELAAKPSPLMLHHAMTSHQVLPSETWMVGDSTADLLAGHAAGCAKVVLCEALKVPPWIEQAVVIEDLAHILKHVSETITH